MNLYDFHIHSFIPPLFLITFLFVEKKRFKIAYITATLATLTIEAAPPLLLASMIGVTLREKLRHGSVRPYLPLLLIPVVVFVMAVLVMNLLAPTPFARLSVPLLMKGIGDTSIGEAASILLSTQLAEIILNDWPDKTFYWIVIFTPVAFLPLLSPFELIGVMPWLAFTWLTLNRNLYLPGFQYSAFVLAPLYYATIKSSAKFTKRVVIRLFLNPARFIVLTAVNPTRFIVLAAVFSALIGPMTPFFSADHGTAYVKPEISQHTAYLRALIATIPANVSLLVQTELFPHVSNRREAYVWFPKTKNNCSLDMIILDVKLDGIRNNVWNTSTVEQTQRLLSTGCYHLKILRDGIVVWSKERGSIVDFEPMNWNIEPQMLYTIEGHHFMKDGMVYIGSKATAKAGDTIWFGPYMPVPPGRYIAELVFEELEGQLIVYVKGKIYGWPNRTLWVFHLAGKGDSRIAVIGFTLHVPVEDLEIVGVAGADSLVVLRVIKLRLVSPP